MNTSAESPAGWIVQVRRGKLVQGRPLLLLYAAGYAIASEAETAVMNERNTLGESYRVARPIGAQEAVEMELECEEVRLIMDAIGP